MTDTAPAAALDALTRVVAELDRLAALDTVQADDGRANTFATGARWTIRMIREAIGNDTPTPCGASITGAFGAPLGPCARPLGHQEAYHRTASGTSWFLTDGTPAPKEPTR